MRHARGLPVIGATAVLLTLLTACVPEPEPTPTPTPTGFANSTEAFAAAEQTYHDYIDALNAVD
ncbi:MAG: hypothetical protein ACK5KK_00615, partial [Microbacterium sp.]